MLFASESMHSWIVQGQVVQLKPFSLKFHTEIRFWDIFDYNSSWKVVSLYLLDEMDWSVPSGVSNFRTNDTDIDMSDN